jgi:MATE family multidrug resistance protein
MPDEEKGSLIHSIAFEALPIHDNEDNKDDTTKTSDTLRPSAWKDAYDTIILGIPIFGSMLSWVGMKTTDSALLGHISAQALVASSLSDLFTMCTGVFIQARVLSILCGNAVGAGNPKLAGIYLQVSLCVLMGVVLLIGLIWQTTAWFWVQMGTDPTAASMAGYYARVLSLSLPAQLGFTQLSQYFQAQRIMHPEVNAATVAMLLNLIAGLVFVLGVGIPEWEGYGFQACPWVTTCVVYFQLAFLWIIYIHKQQLHQPCWGGWKWSEVTSTRIRTFLDLYAPAALGSASDFWRVAVIGTFVVKYLGETAVAVFNTSYRVMWIVLTLISALSSAAGIQTTIRLGKQDALGAKQAGEVGIYMSAVILTLVGGFIVGNVRLLGRLFTADEQFLAELEGAKWPFMTTLVLMNLSVAIERIPYSMGRTREVFWYGFIASWGGQVPGVFFCLRYWRTDLVGLYTGMTLGYAMLTLLYGYMCFTRYVKLSRGPPRSQ